MAFQCRCSYHRGGFVKDIFSECFISCLTIFSFQFQFSISAVSNYSLFGKEVLINQACIHIRNAMPGLENSSQYNIFHINQGLTMPEQNSYLS